MWSCCLTARRDSSNGGHCESLLELQDGFSEFHEATIGVDFRSVVTLIRGKVCTLQVWDTAGQERFSGMTSSYYRYADAFVLVYDSTRESSFKNLDRWIRQVWPLSSGSHWLAFGCFHMLDAAFNFMFSFCLGFDQRSEIACTSDLCIWCIVD